MRYTRPGEYYLKSIRLISDHENNHNIDISPLVMELNIYENMFLSCISGKLFINDTHNLISNFPIIGQETVSVGLSSFKMDGTEVFYQHEFKVYNYSSRIATNDSLSYVLELISPEQLINEQKKVCKSYKNMNPHKAAMDILTNYSYGLDIDSRRVQFSKTYPESSYVIPNWRPFDALNWLAKNSLSNAGGQDFSVFFYESFSPKSNETHVRSTFNFRSFADMLNDQSETVNYTYYPVSDSSDRRGMEATEASTTEARKNLLTPAIAEPIYTDSHHRIRSYKILEPYNIIKNINMGMYSTTIKSHDIIERKITKYEYKYSSDKNDGLTRRFGGQGKDYDLIDITQGSINKRSDYSNSLDSRVVYHTVSHDWQRKFPYYMFPLRKSQLKRYDNTRMSLTISGNIERTIGDIIGVRIPSADSRMSGNLDNLYSGQYIITNIRHKFTPATYEMHLDVTKDNYFKTLSSIREGK